MRLKIAIRNILRNRGRSLLSILMIAGAVTGVILFRGFSSYILAILRDTAIDNQYQHLQVATRAYWDLKPVGRKAQFLADYPALAKAVEAVPGVLAASGRLSFYGLISTGDTTISAKGMGFDPVKEASLRTALPIVEGEGLREDAKSAVLLGTGLKRALNAQVGQTVTALGYTLDGVVNAADLTVTGVFQTGVADFDNHVFMLPLSEAQTLLDTQGVENLAIRLRRTEDTDRIREEVQRVARADNPEYVTKAWYDLASLFRQVKSFYVVQNRVIEIILVSLILLGIMNTVGMSVYERTGEIGTIRALGETERSVVWQFTIEGACLGAIGVLAGFALGTALACLVSSMGLAMDLPNSSSPVPVRIDLVPSAYFDAAMIGFVAAVAATWWPSIRASRISIVEALRKNI